MKRIWQRLLNEPVYLYGTLSTVLIALNTQDVPTWVGWASIVLNALLAREVRGNVSPVELEKATYKVTTAK